jgi:hypothetical protein
MSDQQADLPVEYQDSTQDPEHTGPDHTPAEHTGVEQGDPPADQPRSTGRPDAPPVVHSGREMHEDELHDGPDQGEGNLVQLPQGATFGQEGEPSAAERERLARFAGGVEREMQQEAADQSPAEE